MYNLTFCTSVAYSAPANFQNSKFSNTTALAQHYDNYASSLYTNFSYSLQQVPCNTTSSAQYSLTRNCTDCAEAYKIWLCAVTIPRCEDFSNPAQFLQPRAMNQSFTNSTLSGLTENDPTFRRQNNSRAYSNSSRNPMIDSEIKPGPYKEVLPCEELCYGLVQSCPASLQFVCPLKDHGLNYTYGTKVKGSGAVTCSFPGAGINTISSSNQMRPSIRWIPLGIVLILLAA